MIDQELEQKLDAITGEIKGKLDTFQQAAGDDSRKIEGKLDSFFKFKIISFFFILLMGILLIIGVKMYVDKKFESVQRSSAVGTVLFKDVSGIELIYVERVGTVCFGQSCWGIENAPSGIKRYYTPEMLAKIAPPSTPVREVSLPVIPKPVKVERVESSEDDDQDMIEVDEETGLPTDD